MDLFNELKLARGVVFNETQARSLVLNASYEPIKIVNWQKAILLWFTNKVEVLEFHSIQVRSASESFSLPSVLILNRYISARHINSIRFCRENIYVRDNFSCQYCGDKLSYRKLTLDHVHPVSRGGEHSWENVVTACSPCNNKKAAKTPREARMPLLSRPAKPKFLPNRVLNRNMEKVPKNWGPYLPAIAG